VSGRPKKPAKDSIQLIPQIGWKEEQISRLTQFEPHKLDDIVQDAGATSKQLSNNADTVLTSFRRKNDEQIEQLLREMHIDLEQPDAWRKAFFKLAVIHHGVGGLSTTPPRQKNKNAAKWTSEHHLIFYQMMQVLLQEGKSERDAVKVIANDKTRWEQFPNQGQNRPSSTSDDASKRQAAFWARWVKIIKLAPPPGSLLRAVVGDYPLKGTKKQQDSWIADSLKSEPPGLVKIKPD
jgi:hypothetical protein